METVAKEPGAQGHGETAAVRTPRNRPEWETPTLEDVSEQVMAQPYIRFT